MTELERLRRENARLRLALEYLADKESWLGNPLAADAMLFGHDSVYELAVAALAEATV
jgi:hypothetical protein